MELTKYFDYNDLVSQMSFTHGQSLYSPKQQFYFIDV